jgi:hypothetical protein
LKHPPPNPGWLGIGGQCCRSIASCSCAARGSSASEVRSACSGAVRFGRHPLFRARRPAPSRREQRSGPAWHVGRVSRPCWAHHDGDQFLLGVGGMPAMNYRNDARDTRVHHGVGFTLLCKLVVCSPDGKRRVHRVIIPWWPPRRTLWVIFPCRAPDANGRKTSASLRSDRHPAMRNLGRKLQCASQERNQLLGSGDAPSGAPAGFALPLSRSDIADYLGVSVEIGSRSLSGLKAVQRDQAAGHPNDQHLGSRRARGRGCNVHRFQSRANPTRRRHA